MQEKRRKYSPEFKVEAARLVVESSRPIVEVAREIGVHEGTLGSWVSKYRTEHAGDEPALTLSERARLRELEREVRELRMKTEFLGKAAAFFASGVSVSEKYAFIDAEKARYPIAKMCVWLEVSASGYYEWGERPLSATAQRRKRLAALVQAIFDESEGTYGYRRVHAALARQGQGCGPELVRDIMRELDLVACQARPWRPTTTQAGEGGQEVADLVGRNFKADAPGTRMVGDITYLPTREGFAYLATVIDCCTKECLGYAIADHMRTELVIDAIRMAARNYCLQSGAIFHTDRGSQYLSQAFTEVVNQLDLRHSVGRVGSCFDNAAAESFNATLKVERVNRTVYSTREYARKDVARYIEFRYNTKRLHSALGYRTPQEARVDYQNRRQAA